jgi:hypothetical protein
VPQSTSLTKRQRVLYDRLLVLGDWATNRLLPIDATQIIGFGSFFRGKPQPKDVDIVIQHTKNDSADFKRFRRMLHAVRRDMKRRETFDTPQAALLDLFDEQREPMLPNCTDLMTEERAVFASWCEGISWNMLHPQTIAGQVEVEGPEFYAKRFIRRRLPNVNVVLFLGPAQTFEKTGLRTEVSVSIWSREQRNIHANLEWVLSPTHLQNRTVEELANFDRQVFRLNTLLDMFRLALSLLFETPRSERPLEPQNWLKVWCERHKSKVVDAAMFRDLWADGWLLDEEEIGSELGIRYTQPSYDGASDVEVRDFCERRRAEIKQLWPIVEVYRDIIRNLVVYKAGSVRTNQNAKHFIVSRLLCQWNSRDEKEYVPILRELGFPVDTMRADTPVELSLFR